MKILADMHIHTINSHDAPVPVLDMVRAEVEAGVPIVAIADHWDGFRCLDGGNQDLFGHIQACYEDVLAARKEMGDACQVLMSIELGEPHWDYAQSAKTIGMLPYDSVIGSIHAVRCQETEGCTGLDRAYSRMNFTDMTDEDLDRFLRLYFEETLTMVKTVDIDILAHLASPKILVLRRQNREIDLHPYGDLIDEILRVLIDRGITLEFNSAELDTDGLYAPDPWIVGRFLELGGKRITLASDAHFLHEAGRGMRKAIEILKDLGATEAYYIKERKFYSYPL